MHFRNEYYFLSNMFPYPIKMELDGNTYTFPCAESAFQAAKCPVQAKYFATGPQNRHENGRAAKRAGKSVPLRPDWETVKVSIMASVLYAKFSIPHLEKQLLAVQGEIVEDNTWRDRYWGRCNGTGQNYLGRLLMQVRALPPSAGGTPEQWVANL